MSEGATRRIVGALAAGRPASLVELRLADNRLRVGARLALLDALRRVGVSLKVLDLSSNELCGGTVAEDNTFGAVRASAARLSEHGSVCRLDSDGLCSVGPLMARNSGTYRVDLEIVQASDGDGAYIGLIRPDANRSSYPGFDDKGIGWRAKGGVRHLHNTADVGGTIASWGQGDRVGLVLDTATAEVAFVKNGKTFEQKYNVSLGSGMYFAVGRYYGSFVVRCLYVQQQGGSEEMDYRALERLCAWVKQPSNGLRELALGNNQLTGVSKFHSGRRNGRGLELLLDAFSHAAARITHLDIRANGLSTADAAAVLAVALRPDAACTHLRVHQWGVRVQQLANDVALDLRGQQMEDDDATLLARLLESRTQLTRLDLSDNSLDAPGVSAIAAVISQSALPLLELRIARNGLGAAAAAALLGALAEIPTQTLTSLDLSHNPITDGAGGTFDGAALQCLRVLLAREDGTLRTLRLAATQLCGGDAEAAYTKEGRRCSRAPSAAAPPPSAAFTSKAIGCATPRHSSSPTPSANAPPPPTPSPPTAPPPTAPTARRRAAPAASASTCRRTRCRPTRSRGCGRCAASPPPSRSRCASAHSSASTSACTAPPPTRARSTSPTAAGRW